MLPRRVIYATLVSLAIHAAIFLVLALTTRFTPDFQKHREEALMAIAPIPEEPLEVVFHAAPAPPEPTPEPAQPAPKPLDAAAEAEVVALRTRLDPRQVMPTEAAPQGAEVIASTHSRATRAAANREPEALPKPTPVPAAGHPLFRTATAEPPAGRVEPERDALPDGANAEELEESDLGSVAALGDWRQAVANAVGGRWEDYRMSQKGALRLGSVRMRFKVDAGGKVSDVRVDSNSAGPANAIYATRSIIEATIPPIPADRLRHLPGGSVEIAFTFTIYPH